MRKDLISTVIFFVLLISSAIIYGINGNGEKIFRIILTFIILIVLIIGYLRFNINKVIYNIILSFFFISIYLGNILNFYSITFYDKILHIISGILLYIIGEIVFYKYIKDEYKIIKLIIPMLFSIAFAGLWEIWEYTTDVFLGFSSQGGLGDTMKDIICGSLGALFTFFSYYSKKNLIKR